MAAGTPTYPTTLDTDATLGPTSSIVAGTTTLSAGDQLGISKNIQNTVIALETAVGVTNSTVTTSHEYRIRRLQWFQLTALQAISPATNYGVFSTVNNTPFLSFASGTTIGSIFMGIVPWGAVLTGGVIVRLKWASATATTGNCNWGAAYERFGTLTTVSDHFGTPVTQATAANTTVALVTETAITIPYANMASAVAGDGFRLQIQRVTGASDTMAGAAQLFLVSIENAT